MVVAAWGSTTGRRPGRRAWDQHAAGAGERADSPGTERGARRPQKTWRWGSRCQVVRRRIRPAAEQARAATSQPAAMSDTRSLLASCGRPCDDRSIVRAPWRQLTPISVAAARWAARQRRTAADRQDVQRRSRRSAAVHTTTSSTLLRPPTSAASSSEVEVHLEPESPDTLRDCLLLTFLHVRGVFDATPVSVSRPSGAGVPGGKWGNGRRRPYRGGSAAAGLRRRVPLSRDDLTGGARIDGADD